MDQMVQSSSAWRSGPLVCRVSWCWIAEHCRSEREVWMNANAALWAGPPGLFFIAVISHQLLFSTRCFLGGSTSEGAGLQGVGENTSQTLALSLQA